MKQRWRLDDDGLRFWREDDDGNVVDKITLNPTQNGNGKIAFTTSDGETKQGVVEPGGASDKGLGQ